MALKSSCHQQGRGSAVVLAAALLVSLLALHLETIHAAATHTVDWDFNSKKSTKRMNFKEGDTLIFKYDPSQHDVAAVDAKGYKSCSATAASAVYSSGKDNVTLVKGRQYFICSIPGHCEQGLKIVVTAS